ncbi:hypothetical protein [Streptomyces boluensis]|uniref:Uncharacterized protein n=1 Tax=Streptomyces boluensis TaxID=1775135 RepID=A0A964XMC4_9ACTN|nr:hypothetical protein [Streptomyces boluensis]NBE54384.1 hypothetical protein [Streptomyces boluensis]
MKNSRSALTDTVRHIERLAQGRGGLAKAVDIDALAHGTGIAPAVVAELLAIREVPESDVTEETATALDRALQPALRNLEQQATPDERIMARHGILQIAQRTALRSGEQRDAVLAFVDDMLTQESCSRHRRAAEPGRRDRGVT